jgi:hypothetical protein
MSADVCMKHQQEDTFENPCRDCIIERLQAEPAKSPETSDAAVVEARFELFHDGTSTETKAYTYSQALDAGVELMKSNPEWKHIEVRNLETNSKAGGVWRNPKEGRLIRSKMLG